MNAFEVEVLFGCDCFLLIFTFICVFSLILWAYVANKDWHPD